MVVVCEALSLSPGPAQTQDCSFPPLAAVEGMLLLQRLSSDLFFQAIACKSVWSHRSLLLGREWMGKAAAYSCLLLPGNKLWWADQASERMGTCNKKDGTEVTVLRNSTTLVMHMKVYDESIQQGERMVPGQRTCRDGQHFIHSTRVPVGPECVPQWPGGRPTLSLLAGPSLALAPCTRSMLAGTEHPRLMQLP